MPSNSLIFAYSLAFSDSQESRRNTEIENIAQCIRIRPSLVVVQNSKDVRPYQKGVVAPARILAQFRVYDGKLEYYRGNNRSDNTRSPHAIRFRKQQLAIRAIRFIVELIVIPIILRLQ